MVSIISQFNSELQQSNQIQKYCINAMEEV